MDIYTKVNESILEALENGVKPWEKPWVANCDNTPHNAISGHVYKGINILICWLSQMKNGYSQNGWVTANQCKQNGWRFAGQKATQIMIFKTHEKKNKDGEKESYAFAKSHNVFNVEQIEGIDEKYLDVPENTTVSCDTIQEMCSALDVDLTHGGGRAMYIPSVDAIRLPYPDTFNTVNDYKSTGFHECVHSTLHESRCNRDSSDYAFEELVAELGSAFLGAKLGLPVGELQHASYIDAWIKRIKDDSKALYRASKLAQTATEYILHEIATHELKEAA